MNQKEIREFLIDARESIEQNVADEQLIAAYNLVIDDLETFDYPI